MSRQPALLIFLSDSHGCLGNQSLSQLSTTSAWSERFHQAQEIDFYFYAATLVLKSSRSVLLGLARNIRGRSSAALVWLNELLIRQVQMSALEHLYSIHRATAPEDVPLRNLKTISTAQRRFHCHCACATFQLVIVQHLRVFVFNALSTGDSSTASFYNKFNYSITADVIAQRIPFRQERVGGLRSNRAELEEIVTISCA